MARHEGRTLKEAIAAAMAGRAGGSPPVAELAAVLSAAFDRAALDIDGGGEPALYREALRLLSTGLLQSRPQAAHERL